MNKLLCLSAVIAAVAFSHPGFSYAQSNEDSEISKQEINLPPEYRAFTKLREINQMQMQFSQIAYQRSASPTIRQFAGEVYSQYSYSDRELTQLAEAMNMPLINFPMNEDDWSSMKGQYEQLLQLSILSGSQLDAKFVSLQVDYHRSSLSSIDSYVGSAKNEYAKQYLTRARDTMSRYYEQAQKLQGNLK